MSKTTVLERLLSFVDEAVRAGRFNSRADFLEQAGLSSGYFGEFEGRIARNRKATITLETARACAGLLGVSVAELTDERDEDLPDVVDKYVGRAWAIQAARNLKLPESAIQLVLREDPGVDPGSMYWFRRIESEALRVRPNEVPSSSPPPAARDDRR